MISREIVKFVYTIKFDWIFGHIMNLTNPVNIGDQIDATGEKL